MVNQPQVLNRTQRLTKWIEKNPNYFRAFVAFFFIVVLWSFITAAFFLYTIHNPNNISPTAADVFGGFELTFAFIFGVLGCVLLYKANQQTVMAQHKYGTTTTHTETTLEEDNMEYAQQPMQMPEEPSAPVSFSRTINSGPTNVGVHMSAPESAASSLL